MDDLRKKEILKNIKVEGVKPEFKNMPNQIILIKKIVVYSDEVDIKVECGFYHDYNSNRKLAIELFKKALDML